MYDFIVGLAFGTLLTRLFTKKHKKDVSTQVEFVSVTMPVQIPRKNFVPGALANFWGKDS
jgi:uncharacterized membrane-anchored protein YhcB (DUF1043 family)